LGFPIVGDEKYGDFVLNKSLHKDGLKRMFLHAWKISFPHPLLGSQVALEAALPNALESFLHRLSTIEMQDFGPTF
jgi:23S rRNA pseudouridine955/2504/2580 synthase